MDAKQAQHTAKTMALCAKAQRTQDDIWFIRDRLHERCPFFRLWPSQLQQLTCRLARPMHWVQHEVLASQGGASCKDLCFILEGKAAVAVRSAPGSSILKDVAPLKDGDTFGELALMGAQHNPAFIVVRSQQLLALAVSAQQLAQAMLKLPAPGPGEMLNSSAAARQQSSQQPGAGEDSMSVDALYKLIGAAKSERQSTLSPEQQAHVSRVQQRQLKQAAEAEAATIGAWLAQPRQQRCAVAEDDDCSSGCMCSDASYRAVSGAEQPRGSAGAAADHLHDAVDVEDSGLAMQAEAGITRSQHAATQQKLCKQHMAKQQQAVAPDTEEAAAGAAKQQRRCKYTRQEAETVVASQGQQADGAMQRGSRASCSSAGGGSASTQSACASSGGSSAGGVAAAVDGRNAGQGQSSTGALLRARHSAILHVAMMKAAAAADSQAAGCVQPGLKQQ